MEYPNDWEKKVFQSRRIHHGEYSPSRRSLALHFPGGVVYDYQVGPDIWTGLKKAQSPGKFLSEHKLIGRRRGK